MYICPAQPATDIDLTKEIVDSTSAVLHHLHYIKLVVLDNEAVCAGCAIMPIAWQRLADQQIKSGSAMSHGLQH